jgi:hypothetical protein
LAKPQVKPSAFWVASRTLRYQVLTWVGIIGGAITLFANLQGILNLADWARWLVTNWHEWTTALWMSAFQSVGIRIPREIAPLLSLFSFCSATVIGARRQFVSLPGNKERAPIDLKRVTIYFIFYVAIFLLANYTMASLITGDDELAALMGLPILARAPAAYGFASLAAIFPCLMFILLHPNNKLAAMTLLVLLAGFYWAIFLSKDLAFYMEIILGLVDETGFLSKSIIFSLVFGFVGGLFFVLPIVMALVAPINALTRRLLFIAIGLGVLTALNELSHYAPAIRALLTPPA